MMFLNFCVFRECPDESDVEDLNVELQKLTIKMKRSDKVITIEINDSMKS